MKAIIFAVALAIFAVSSEVFAGGGVQFFVAPQHVFVPQAVVVQHPQAVVVQRFHAQPFVQRQVVVQQQAAQVNVQVRRGFFPRVFGPRVNVQINR